MSNSVSSRILSTCAFALAVALAFPAVAASDAPKVENTATEPHPFPWPIAQEVPRWGEIMKVRGVTAESKPEKAPEAPPEKAPAQPASWTAKLMNSATEPHPFPWPVAQEVPRWGDVMKVRLANAASTAAPTASAPQSSASACVDELKRIASSGTIRFANASAELDPASAATLQTLAGSIKSCGPAKIRVEAFTDSAGSYVRNLRLSERRAAAVVEYLVNSGVPRSSLRARGFGEERPAAPNDTEENRQKNRRIEFSIR